MLVKLKKKTSRRFFDAVLEVIIVAERIGSWNNYLMVNYWFENYHLSMFQKKYGSPTDRFNQVKSSTKHARPNLS